MESSSFITNQILLRLQTSLSQIEVFCQRWQVEELALFGSILRSDFQAHSDVDILVTFTPPLRHNLNRLMTMTEELEQLFNRSVDLIVKRVIEQDDNPYRRKNILESAYVIYHHE